MAELPPRPSDSHRLAFYFPVKEQRPQLIWLKINELEQCLLCEDPFCTMAVESNVRSYFGDDASLRGMDDDAFSKATDDYIHIDGRQVHANPRNGAGSSRRCLRLTCLNTIYGEPFPDSLYSLTKPNLPHWRGPMVAQAHQASLSGTEECSVIGDVRLADLRLLVDDISSPPALCPIVTKMDDSGDEDDTEDEGDI